VIGGDVPDQRVARHLPAGAEVICADSGLDHADALGLAPSVVVGDLDSVTPAALRRAVEAGVPVVAHPADKDATDTELALQLAVAHGHDHIVVVSGGGGRLDHALGALLALAHVDLAPTSVLEAWIGPARVRVLHGPASATVTAQPGATVSLVPLAGPARAVRTTGLRWALDGEDLTAGSTRGLSNELTAPLATVELVDGVLAIIVPDAVEDPA
jgi:thiamine pyrophosphokinase